MICQNCQARVDDDLIFCTNCGRRLSQPQTVLINEPAATENNPTVAPTAAVKTPKSSSNLKWLSLIVALIAIPASIFGVFLLTRSGNQADVAQNNEKPKMPSASPTRKANSNQNAIANVSNANANTANVNEAVNANANSSKPSRKVEVMNERIEIAPKTHYAKPFTIEGDTTPFVGTSEILQGEEYKGFVYLKSQYEEHFPDELYKIFIFGQEKKSNIKSYLVPEEYVLVYLNETDKPVVVQANLWLEY